MIIGGYFTWISVFGINQTQVQRYLTVPEKHKVVKWVNKHTIKVYAYAPYQYIAKLIQQPIPKQQILNLITNKIVFDEKQ